MRIVLKPEKKLPLPCFQTQPKPLGFKQTELLINLLFS